MKSWQKLKEKRMLDQNSGGAGSSSGAMMKTEWMEGKEPQPSEKEKETIVTKWRKKHTPEGGSALLNPIPS